MNIRNILKPALFLILASSSLAFAAEPGKKKHQHKDLSIEKQVKGTNTKNCDNIVDVKVNGLVCDFCARALEKVFSRRTEVEGIDVDLDNGDVKVELKKGKKLDDKTLKQLVTDSGYSVVSVSKGCKS